MAGFWEIKKVSELGLAFLPLNSIMPIYVKTQAEVTALHGQGWYLCNGQNGTIDLRGSFIRGGSPGLGNNVDGGIHRQGTTTGSHQLSTAEMPNHNHSYTTPRASQGGAGGSWNADLSGSGNTGNTGSSGTHSHSMNPTPDHYYVGYFMYLGVSE